MCTFHKVVSRSFLYSYVAIFTRMHLDSRKETTRTQIPKQSSIRESENLCSGSKANNVEHSSSSTVQALSRSTHNSLLSVLLLSLILYMDIVSTENAAWRTFASILLHGVDSIAASTIAVHEIGFKIQIPHLLERSSKFLFFVGSPRQHE
jgi:hypothetical protein